ncbi:MAG TPA: 3-hydroxyacyl-CoA dehydrogenase family protein [Alphaproteobacteria bacterium]|nr:3-hydroxyacyl-CoA dehydrogenase family protein [Alphaproteobacteria bacterium]
MPQEKVGVVGAGMMGAEIALVFAMAGHDVLLADTGSAVVEAALARLAGVLDKGVERRFWTADAAAAARRNLKPATSLAAYDDRDLVIEAVFEDAAVKGALFRELDEICQPSCVFASNTSTISISTLAANVAPARRGRFLGTHFFSPVSRMKLVEVMPAFDTDAAVVERVTALCREIGKVPVRIKDVPGFAVNRLLHAVFIEAVRLVEEGVATPEDIDTACRLGLGHPVGPFQLMDQVTNGLSLQVQEILQDAYGERFRPRPLMKQMVRAGFDGRKAGRGWFRYETGKRG